MGLGDDDSGHCTMDMTKVGSDGVKGRSGSSRLIQVAHPGMMMTTKSVARY